MNKYLGSSRRHSVKRIISSSMCVYAYMYRHWPCSVLSHSLSFIIIHPVYLSRRIERKKEGSKVKQIFFLLLSFSHWTISARIHLTHTFITIFISLTSKTQENLNFPFPIFIMFKRCVKVNIIWSMLSSNVLIQRCFCFILTN